MKEWIWMIEDYGYGTYSGDEYIHGYIFKLRMEYHSAFIDTWSYNGFLTEC
jgi:hypothetical protein